MFSAAITLWTKVVPAVGFNAGFAKHDASPSRTQAMPRRRPSNRIGKCTPQWLALLIEMRLVTPKQAHEAPLRAERPSDNPHRKKRH